MEFEHFSHEHPLILNENHKDQAICYGCKNPILDIAYSCGLCDFFLHKACADLPRQIKHHPRHSQHPLTLHAFPPYSSKSCICDLCYKSWDRFTYQCKICEFDIDIICTFKERTIQDKCHEHPLTLLPRLALFHCDACDTKDEDESYLCYTCQFWIHKSCVSLPTTFQRPDHDHPLDLIYNFSYELTNNFRHNCYICHESMVPRYSFYCCRKCRDFAHVKCVTSNTQPSKLREGESGSEMDETIKSGLIRFPVTHFVVDLIKPFVEHNRVEEIQKSTAEINHFSHDHMLILSDNEFNDDQFQCEACVLPISTPFYSCGDCSFFLHKSCAELPAKLQHPTHPEHPLVLDRFKQFSSIFECKYCAKYSNEFFYECVTCEEFRIDVKCASLPTTILHESHNHPLIQSRSSKYSCNACLYYQCSTLGFGFGCEACHFHIDIDCLLLPRTFEHRWDKHPYTLIYPPFSDHPDDFLCDICEEFIHPKSWIYHCHDCDQSFHPDCSHPFNRLSNLKFGITLKSESHPHFLTFVRKSNKSPCSCDRCSKRVLFCGKPEDGFPVFECVPCNFQLCQPLIWEELRRIHDAQSVKMQEVNEGQ